MGKCVNPRKPLKIWEPERSDFLFPLPLQELFFRICWFLDPFLVPRELETDRILPFSTLISSSLLYFILTLKVRPPARGSISEGYDDYQRTTFSN